MFRSLGYAMTFAFFLAVTGTAIFFSTSYIAFYVWLGIVVAIFAALFSKLSDTHTQELISYTTLMWVDLTDQVDGTRTIFEVPAFEPGSCFTVRNGVMSFSEAMQLDPNYIHLNTPPSANKDKKETLYFFYRPRWSKQSEAQNLQYYDLRNQVKYYPVVDINNSWPILQIYQVPPFELGTAFVLHNDQVVRILKISDEKIWLDSTEVGMREERKIEKEDRLIFCYRPASETQDE